MKPAGFSYRLSLAVASTSVTRAMGRSLSFSRPPTSTTSARPEPMAMRACRKASPLLAHAHSVRARRNGREAHRIGDEGCHEVLPFEHRAAVVADDERVDVLRIEALVDRSLHLLERLDEQSRVFRPGKAPNEVIPAPTSAAPLFSFLTAMSQFLPSMRTGPKRRRYRSRVWTSITVMRIRDSQARRGYRRAWWRAITSRAAVLRR